MYYSVEFYNKELAEPNQQYHQSKAAIQIEEEQIKRAKKDPQEFGVLYEKYYVQIFRYLFKRIANEDDAAELTSQVFVKAMQSLSKYQFKGVPFGAWLYQIARNELNLAFRSKKYNRSVDVKTEQVHEVIEEFEGEPNEEKTKFLLESLRKLEVDELELLEMRYFEKRPFQEVSEILNITVSNAKVKMHRIIKKLKVIMEVEQA